MVLESQHGAGACIICYYQTSLLGQERKGRFVVVQSLRPDNGWGPCLINLDFNDYSSQPSQPPVYALLVGLEDCKQSLVVACTVLFKLHTPFSSLVRCQCAPLMRPSASVTAFRELEAGNS